MEWRRYFAAAIAVLFAGFTALIGSASLLRQKAQWTLQRMYVSPTDPRIILAGTTLGTYLSILIQMGTLTIGTVGMEWAIGRRPSQDSNIDLLGLSLLILAAAMAAMGLGAMIAGLARTHTQAAVHGRMIVMLMGSAGGVLFPVQLLPRPLQALARITYQYWALDGYTRLALGGGPVNILPHLAVLGAMGLLLFAAGNWFLRRRIGLL
jgi:ABC-2 type transport system permease protein